MLQALRWDAAGSSKPGGPVSITGKGATVPWPNGLRRHSPKVQIQVRFLAGSLARLGRLVKSLGSNPRVSRFESGAAHQRGYSSMAEQPAFNRSTAGSIPRAPTILRSRRPVAAHRPRKSGNDEFDSLRDSSIDPNVLYVDEGNILTSAGRAARLDLCLHVVRLDYGVEIANQAGRRLVVAPHRSGGQAQFIPRPVPRVGDRLGEVFARARRNLDQDLSIDRLAAQACMSRRTLIRRCVEATGLAPCEWVLQARVAEACRRLETTRIGRTDCRRGRPRFGRHPTPPVPHPARDQSGPLSVLLRGVERAG